MTIAAEPLPPAAAAVSTRWGWIEWLLVLWVLLPGVYFFHGSNWNHLSRYDLIFACVEPDTDATGHLWIDPLLPSPPQCLNTGDWAINPAHGPHYYSNKAPGPALAGIPAYYLLYWGERALGYAPTAPAITQLNCYLLNLLLSVLPLALALPLFYHTLRRLGPHAPRLALAVTLALPATTLLWPYTTQLWGHATAAAMVIVALWGVTRGTVRGAVWAGAAAGAAVLCEYSCAIVVVALAALLVAQRDWPRLRAYVFGGLPMLGIHSIYHQLCFGAPWGLANFYNNPAFLDPTRAGGLFGGIDPAALTGLTISPHRGLLYYMPVLVLAAAGVLALSRRRLRGIAAVCLASAALFLAWNLTFFGWNGGACMGPRYQIPVLPCYFVLLFIGALHLRAWARLDVSRHVADLVRASWNSVFGVVVVWSFANTFILLAVSPLVLDATWPNPMAIYRKAVWFDFCRTAHVPWKKVGLWYTPSPAVLRELPPNLLHPFKLPDLRIGPNVPPIPQDLARFNLGERAGLVGMAAIFPWLGLQLALLGVLIWRRPRRGVGRWQGIPPPSADPGDAPLTGPPAGW